MRRTSLVGLLSTAVLMVLVGLPAAASAGPGDPTVAHRSYAASTSTQAMDVYTPPASQGTGPFPAVVLVHGGGFVSGDTTEYNDIGPALARRGYVAVAINYAMPAPGFPTELGDVVAAVSTVRSQATALKVDTGRLALWGGSAGANLVAMAATARQLPVRAVVGWSGPYDMGTPNTGLYLRDTLDNRSTYLGCDVRTTACQTGKARQASPANFVTASTPPMLLVDSANDYRQPREQLEAMRQAMAAAGRPVSTFVFPGTVHTESPEFPAAATGPSIDYLDTILKPSTPSADPTDPVDAYYQRLGGSASYLGAPTSAAYTVAGGRARDYRGGTIYYSSATAAHVVQGTILARYKALGGPGGTLGFPTGDELVAADGKGRRGEFAGAGGSALVWNPANNTARALTGPSWTHYRELGETRSVLAYPTTDTTATPDGRGRFTHFAGTGGASIYLNPTRGRAYAVYGTIRARWAQLGYERSTLGYPTSDEYAVTVGRRNDFDRGAITWTARTGATTVSSIP